jgi:hypothetical protein
MFLIIFLFYLCSWSPRLACSNMFQMVISNIGEVGYTYCPQSLLRQKIPSDTTCCVQIPPLLQKLTESCDILKPCKAVKSYMHSVPNCPMTYYGTYTLLTTCVQICSLQVLPNSKKNTWQFTVCQSAYKV